MIPYRAIAFLLGFFGLTAASLAVPVLGVANYMLIYQIFPEHTWWYIPIAPLGIRYSMTAALSMIFGLLLNLGRLPRVRPLISLWDLTALGLVIVVICGDLIVARPSPVAGELTSKFVKVMIFVFCMTRITTTKRNYLIVMWALVLGSFYIGYDAWTAPRGAFEQGRLQRIGGPDFRHSSGLAAHMGAMLPLIGVAFMATKSWSLRAIALMSGALTLNTVVLCRTRSAFVGISVGIFAAVLTAPKRRRFRTYMVFMILAPCVYRLTDTMFWERMATLGDHTALRQESAAAGRLEIWAAASTLIAWHPFGVGIGNFQYRIHEVNYDLGQRAAHNSFILCWAELGIQGFVLFLLIISISIVQTWQCYSRAAQTDNPAWTRYMAYGIFLSLIISLSTQMFTERLYTESFWWLLALPGCLKRVVLRESARVAAPIERNPLVDIDVWNQNNPLLSRRHARATLA